MQHLHLSGSPNRRMERQNVRSRQRDQGLYLYRRLWPFCTAFNRNAAMGTYFLLFLWPIFAALLGTTLGTTTGPNCHWSCLQIHFMDLPCLWTMISAHCRDHQHPKNKNRSSSNHHNHPHRPQVKFIPMVQAGAATWLQVPNWTWTFASPCKFRKNREKLYKG